MGAVGEDPLGQQGIGGHVRAVDGHALGTHVGGALKSNGMVIANDDILTASGDGIDLGIGVSGRSSNRRNNLHPAITLCRHIIRAFPSDADPLADGSLACHVIRSQRNGLRRGVGLAVFRQAKRNVGNGSIAIGAVITGRLQIVQAVGAVTLHGDFGAGDGKDGHRQLVGACGSIVGIGVGVVTGITGIHIGEVQGLLGPFAGGTGLSDADLIAHGQIDGLAAHIVIRAVCVVMTVQEDDVQAVLTGVIQHVKDILGVLGIALGHGTGGEGQRQVGDNEDGGGVALANLIVQPGLEIVCKSLDTGLRAAAIGIVVLVQNVCGIVVCTITVYIHIMSARSVDAGIHIVMVTLYKNGVRIVQIGICFLNGAHKRIDTAFGRVCVIVSFAVVVTNEQEPVHCLIFLADLRQDIRYIRRAVSGVSCFLEVAACQNIDRLFSAAARGKYTCRQQ